jgi:hypothetical protein
MLNVIVGGGFAEVSTVRAAAPGANLSLRLIEATCAGTIAEVT